MLTDTRAFFLFAVLAASAVVATGPLQDPDLWWHIKTGETIVAARSFPTEDIYSFTAAGRPWRAYSWLPEIVFYAVSRAGFFLLIMLRIAVFSATAALLFTVVDKFVGNPQVSALAVFAGWCSVYPVWSLRPHAVSMFFFAWLAAAFALRREKKADLFPLAPAVFLVWANSHVYFATGLALFAAYVFYEKFFDGKSDNAAALWLAASAAATFANPYGAAVYAQYWELASHSWTWRWVMEMGRPYPWDSRVAAFWFYVAASAAVFWRLRKNFDAFYGALAAFSFLYSLTALRHIFMYPVVSLPVLAALVSRARPPLPAARLTKKTAWLFSAALTVIFGFRAAADYKSPVAPSVPSASADYIMKNRPPQPLANYFDFGGYFIYALWPEYKVFMDGRTQVYSPDFLDEYARLQSPDAAAEDAFSIFKKYKIKTVVWAADHQLASRLKLRELYRDKTAVIFAVD